MSVVAKKYFVTALLLSKATRDSRTRASHITYKYDRLIKHSYGNLSLYKNTGCALIGTASAMVANTLSSKLPPHC